MPKPRARLELTESPEGMSVEPPLLRFIRSLKTSDKECATKNYELFVDGLKHASGKERTGHYLYQLSGKAVPNPTLRLAKAIVEQTRIFAPRVSERPLSYEDLLIGKVAE